MICMYYILYNEKSNQGKAVGTAAKLYKKLSKKHETMIKSVFDILGREKEYIAELNPEDIIVIIGGDGTFHQFVNAIKPNKVNCRVFALASGTGNDFSRDYKRKKMFEITHIINDLPLLTINDEKEFIFLNGCGIGVDSLVCYEKDLALKKGEKASYLNVAINVIKNFKPYTLDLVIDGKPYHYEKVWFFVCNNGRFFGGGMKVTPKAVREDDQLDICVVHSIGLKKLIFILPTVFFGWHVIFKKYVTFIRGKHITVDTHGACDVLQRDGEVTTGVEKMEVRR